MNSFQQNILNQIPQFTLSDFTYFLGCSQEKVRLLPLDKKCTIHQTFINSHEAEYLRAEYCLKNCGFKCLDITPGTHKTILNPQGCVSDCNEESIGEYFNI